MKRLRVWGLRAIVLAAAVGGASGVGWMAKAVPTAATDAYPRHPLTLVDQVEPGSDFFEFRERLRQAVRERDAAFIRRIADPQIKLSFGPAMTLADLDIDNPNAPVWQYLERSIDAGCAAQTQSNSEAMLWICPHVFLAPEQDAAIDAFASVVVVGQDVNVRAHPTRHSPVIGTASNEVLKFDQSAHAEQSRAFWQAKETNAGWIPVILPSGSRGYISSRYAYTPAGYRAFFNKINGQWTMTLFIAGD